MFWNIPMTPQNFPQIILMTNVFFSPLSFFFQADHWWKSCDYKLRQPTESPHDEPVHVPDPTKIHLREEVGACSTCQELPPQLMHGPYWLTHPLNGPLNQ